MIPLNENRPSWLKSRGYLHVTPKLDVFKNSSELISKVQNEGFVAKHSFSPLIHSNIKERKYKKIPLDEYQLNNEASNKDSGGNTKKKRAHSYKDSKSPYKVKKSTKIRPLHYSTHIDALIFGYYAEILQGLYEEELNKRKGLSECIIAYRKIVLDDDDGSGKGKSTIHFASEVFQEIKMRATIDDHGCSVLMFDIKSFFNEIDHNTLKSAWCDLFKVRKLNGAHYNVFKAATDFRYILLDDLRKRSNNIKQKGFDERKLFQIRRNTGKEAFFESFQEFRKILKEKQIKVFKHPFVKRIEQHKNTKGKRYIIKGIPQGLPISAVLANLYLLNFDKSILNEVVEKYDAYYRRYSDDILIVCKPDEAADIENYIMEKILSSHVKISREKTEKYLFKNIQVGYEENRLTSILISEKKCDPNYRVLEDYCLGDCCSLGRPLTYLGFEFYGYKTLIKSANLARFYRRIIYAVKRKALRASRIQSKEGGPFVIFKGQLKRLYRHVNLNKEKQHERKQLKLNKDRYYSYQKVEIEKNSPIPYSTYLSYVDRASKIMDSGEIRKQLDKHNVVFHQAMCRFKKKYSSPN